MTAIMMCGGHRDGEILEVPGGIEPISKVVRLTIKLPFDPYGPPIDIDTTQPTKFIDLQIVPRHAFSGPAWKIDLPKELW